MCGGRERKESKKGKKGEVKKRRGQRGRGGWRSWKVKGSAKGRMLMSVVKMRLKIERQCEKREKETDGRSACCVGLFLRFVRAPFE